MTRRRIVTGTIVAGLAIAAVVFLTIRDRRPQLPPVARYGNLPASFNQALQAARDSLRSPANEPDAVRKLARLYQANRLLPEAQACYRVIESTAGLNARDHYYLADIAQSENDLPAAEKELRSVLQLEPGNGPARVALADSLFKSGREDEAAKEYAAVVASEPNQPQASFGLARIALQRGDDESAVKRLTELMASHPESTSGAGLLAQILERRGEAERAAAMTQWSQQQHEPVPPDPWMDALLADCYDVHRLALVSEQYLTAGQMAEALPFLDRIAELDPTSWIPPTLRGWSLKRAGHEREAVEEYRQALRQGGDPEKICPLLVASLLALGEKTEAAALLAEYHAKLPDSIPILRSYAEVAVKQGNNPLARELLTKVLQAEPYSYLPNMSMVSILWNAGERDSAALYLQRVARVFPADVDSRGLLGQYYLEKSDPASAIFPLEQALAHVPPQAAERDRLTSMLTTAYLMAGSLEAEKGHFAVAVGYADKAIRVAPADVKGYALEANVYTHQKDFPHAAAVLEKMISIDPGNPTIHLRLGDALYQGGDAVQARQHWELARDFSAGSDNQLRGAIDDRLSGRISTDTFR